MKGLYTLVLISLFLTIAPQAWAQGDVGSPECGAVQADAQAAVAGGGPYKNQGQLVRTAAHVVGPEADAGNITAECASCIINQFARGIPIEEQGPCGGTECAHDPCQTGVPLDAEACGEDVATVCQNDPYCCGGCSGNNSCCNGPEAECWDIFCVAAYNVLTGSCGDL